MAATRRYGTAPLQDIMEKDIEICVKKAKTRYSSDHYFYISECLGYYCADSSNVMLKPEQIIRTYENVNYSAINQSRAKWVEVK